MRNIDREELRKHKTKEDRIWTVLKGKVYDITEYFEYHPGGEAELMKAAGKDCTALFNKRHPWVNIDGFLSRCFVGVFVKKDVKEK